MSFGRRWFHLLIVALLGIAAAASSHAQIAQPMVLPTGNWPVSVVTGDAQPHDGVPDLVYCDPAIHSGCHLLKGGGNGAFTKVQDLRVPTPGDDGFYTATFIDTFPISSVVTLSTRTDFPNFMDLTYFYSPGFDSMGFMTQGTKPDVAGPVQSFDWFSSAPGVFNGFLAEEMANGYLYCLSTSANVLAAIPLTNGPGPFITGDFNGDRTTDILVLGTTNHIITLYLGQGYGAFGSGTQISLPGGIYSMLVADIDGDNIPDLVVEGANGALSYFPGTPSGFATTAIPIGNAQDGTTGNGGHLVAIADLNGDHIPDIITSTPAGISVLLGQPPLNAHIPYSPSYTLLGIYNAGPGRSSYALADFNGDGHLDLAVDSPEGIAILYGNADGSFQTSRSYAAGQPAYSLALGRFNSKSFFEIAPVDAVVATGIPQFQVLTGDDKGGFSITTPPWPAGSLQTNSTRTEWSSALQSFLDTDYILDLAVTKNGKPSTDTAGITLYYGNGDRTFSAPVVADPNGSNHIGASNFATFSANNGTVYILNADTTGCGSFSMASRTTTGPGSIFTSNPTGSPYNLVIPGYLTAGSNYVSRNDIVCELNGSLYIYKNNGSGSFGSPTILPAPAGIAIPDSTGALPATGLFPSALLFADLDGDGFGDLIAIYHNLASDPAHPTAATPNQIYIYWGNGDGTFATPTILTPTRNYYQASLAEIDSNNTFDLILSDGYLVSVLPNNGLSRTFGAEQHYLAGMGINGIASYPVNAHNVIVTANGGAVFTNPAINRGTLASNAEVSTGGITVLLPAANPLNTTLTGTLTATPTNPGYGRNFTLTATLTPPSGGAIPTGTVTFSIDGAVVATSIAVDTTGTATYTVNSPTYAVGTHTLTAVYSGDATYGALTLNGSVTVTLLPSQTYITNIVTPILYGDIIGNVAQGFAAPLNSSDTALLDGGNLVFFINGQAVCTLPFITGITQTCPPTTGAGYPVGTYTLSSAYTGNQFYLPSTSPNYTVMVIPADTQGTLTSSLNPAVVGQAATFTATFTSPFTTPTGTVTFFDGATAIGSATLNAGGMATLTTSTLAIGTHPITATLAASLNFNGSSTAALQQVITPPVDPINTTTTVLISSINPSNVGQSVTFTATVTPQFGNGIPTGSITFTVDGVVIGTVTLNAQGIATINSSTLTAGSHIIAASYSGSPTGSTPIYLSSAATLVQQVNAILAGSFTLTVTPTTLSVPIGNSAIALVTVTELNGFSQPVTLSCDNLARGVTCAFTSTTIPAGGGSTQLAVHATAPHDCNNTAPYFVSSGSSSWLGLVASSGLILLLRRRRKLITAIALTLALCILPTTIGCGNCTDLGVYPGNYTFTVTATSTTPTAITATQTIKMTAHL